jgi:hypothetical protein
MRFDGYYLVLKGESEYRFQGVAAKYSIINNSTASRGKCVCSGINGQGLPEIRMPG